MQGAGEGSLPQSGRSPLVTELTSLWHSRLLICFPPQDCQHPNGRAESHGTVANTGLPQTDVKDAAVLRESCPYNSCRA